MNSTERSIRENRETLLEEKVRDARRGVALLVTALVVLGVALSVTGIPRPLFVSTVLLMTIEAFGVGVKWTAIYYLASMPENP